MFKLIYRAKGVVFDTFAWLLTITAFLIFIMVEIEATNLNDFSEAIQGLLGLSLMIIGIVFSSISVGIRTDNKLTRSELNQTFTLFVVGFLFVAALMFVRRLLFPQSILSSDLMVVLLAIAETVFLIGLFELFGYTSGNNWIMAAVVTSTFWAISHVFVYGFDFTILIPIVLIGIVLLIVYRASGNRVSVPTLIHLLNNVIVVASPFGLSLIAIAFMPLIIFVFIGGGKKKWLRL